MSPTLQNNCVLLINKNIDRNSILSGILPCIIKKQDIVVFLKPEWNPAKKDDQVYVKRCVGLPGDIVELHHERLTRKVRPIPGQQSVMYLFPQDTLFKEWSLTDYGPLMIPKKDWLIRLTPCTIRLYKKLIVFENKSVVIIGDKVIINGELRSDYIFKHNYYFMVGDNFMMSEDSRFWGCVPDISLVGKVIWHS
jgi:signal peptidase I